MDKIIYIVMNITVNVKKGPDCESADGGSRPASERGPDIPIF